MASPIFIELLCGLPKHVISSRFPDFFFSCIYLRRFCCTCIIEEKQLNHFNSMPGSPSNDVQVPCNCYSSYLIQKTQRSTCQFGVVVNLKQTKWTKKFLIKQKVMKLSIFWRTWRRNNTQIWILMITLKKRFWITNVKWNLLVQMKQFKWTR